MLTTYDATVSVLTPLFVSACILTSFGSTLPLKGQTIQYKTSGMNEPAKFTYGCTEDWFDVTTADEVDNVYVFPTSNIPKYAREVTHKATETFVIQGKLNEAVLGTGETHAERFGSGLMYYNATVGRSEVFKSGEMQISQATRISQASNAEYMSPGCQKRAGNLKSACNLVCFDLVDGILTDFQQDSTVLVHHISVATIATEDQATDEKKFSSSARKSRRMLLESVSTFPSGLERALASGEVSRDTSGDKSALTAITVTSKTTSNTTSSSDEDDDETNVGAIVGGSVTGAILVGLVIYGFYRYGVCNNCFAAGAKKRKKYSSKSSDETL